MSNFLEKIGGRKLGLTLIIFATSTLLLILSKLGQPEYFSLIKVLIVAYLGGNILQYGVVKKTTDPKLDLAETAIETIAGEDTIQTMAGRKFWFIFGIYTVIFILIIVKVLEQTFYVDISSWLISGYIVGNVGSKAAQNGFSINVNK